jgi:fructose-1,6-bisphosphatase/inositol monophosphatase family enzyme
MNNLFNSADFAFFKSLLTEAGELGVDMQKGVLEVRRKQDGSIVTQADPAIQELLIGRISERYAGFHFVYEENFTGGTPDVEDETVTVIIDPIDGSAMYSMYLPIWCISIGIFRGYNPLYGFVYSPGLNLYFHNDDRNAYLNDEIKLVEKVVHLDSESNIFHASEVHSAFFIDFPGKVRNLGSTALHACLTVDNARNRAVAFIGKSNLWDWAGAIPVILKARGRLRYHSGADADYRAVINNSYMFPDFLIAYNVPDFETIKKIFVRR